MAETRKPSSAKRPKRDASALESPSDEMDALDWLPIRVFLATFTFLAALLLVRQAGGFSEPLNAATLMEDGLAAGLFGSVYWVLLLMMRPSSKKPGRE